MRREFKAKVAAAVEGLAGDYNNNGLVEQADLDLVLGHWGIAAANAPAAWTNDPPTGNIDQDELDKVLSGWGDTAPSIAAATAAVSEPSSAWLSIIVTSAVAMIWTLLRFDRHCTRRFVYE